MKQIRTSKFSKFVAYYLAIMMFLQITQPMQMYALTEGPSQPEFNSFTPIGTSDMVDLASGDFNYNIPIMDVGGYPLNLAYNSGVTMDQEASWVGLGWNLNVGQINRQMRGLPDDFNGDPMTYENNMKENVTVGGNVGVNIALFGVGEDNEPPSLDLSVGMGIKFNNYNGLTASATGGLSYDISESLNVGLQLESSASEGVSVSPSASFSSKLNKNNLSDYSLGASAGVSYNSRKGIESMTITPSVKKNISQAWRKKVENDNRPDKIGVGATLSYNPDASYTPTKRVGMKSSNYMFNMNLGGEVWGFEPGVKFSGFRTSQGIDDSEKYKVERGYGYENSYNASVYDVLDFNREKDRTVSRNTNILPVTNYTYDIYSVQGQGVSGMFRPYHGQVGYVFDKYTIDKSNGGQLGVEIQVGGGNHWGFNGSVTNSNSSTGLWYSGNPALPRFLEEKNVKPDYEKVYFKNVGGTHVDKERYLLTNKLGEYSAIKFSLQGGQLARATTPQYYNSNGIIVEDASKIRREKRVNRNQSIQKLTRKEASRFGFSKSFSKYAKNHHTAEIQILKDGGERYIFGKPLYNVVKKEVTFDVSGGGDAVADCKTGLVPYSANSDNSLSNNRNGDQYFNRVTTPAYAHTYLLTYVLSADYQDLPGENFGRVSDDDLGTYTKFTYNDVSKNEDGSSNLYKWRVPFAENRANYDEGLKSSEKDNKGNYQYGEKEMSYIEKIETKTHVAIFEISERKDGYGVKGENGGLGVNSKSYKLNKIKLYAKPEYEAFGDTAKPIKTAHFIYDYSLCLGIDNNNNGNIDDHEIDNQGGKLTLQKVYFTYRDSNMGKYTPYEFSYKKSYIKKIDNTTTEEVPFNYDMKGYDIWGNFKPTSENATCVATSGEMTNAEYPFVDQSDRDLANQYTSAWHLNTVKLPSGGTIEVDYESDDYAYVQNKEVMQMFKVIGAADNKNGDNVSNYLYNALGHSEYIYIKLDKTVSQSEFRNKYIRNLISEPVYFRFLLNMFDPNPLPGADTTEKYDYVTGYLELANDFSVLDGEGDVVAIKVKTVNKGDGVNRNKQVNPITKAGWNFGRSYLNRLVFGINNSEDTNDLEGMVMELALAVPSLIQVFKSPNGRLEQKRIASMFVPNKSWVRLMQPERKKIGGGSRVKEIRLHDEWDVMTDHTGDENYKQFYGQQYSYNLGNNENTTSGVATYEPLGCKENPLVMPFYDRNNKGLLLGPDEQNYVEHPLGESFYPSPKITYSRVVVKNLPRVKEENGEIIKVKKHATGQVVTEFFTSKDYPTLVDVTPISSHYDKPPLASILNINAKDHLTMSQGFAIHTNDMDGKMKSQRVYAEGQTGFISGVDYKYSNNYTNIKEKGLLNNLVKTINSEGKVEDNIVGVDYDVINDFRFNEAITETPGVRFNTAGLPLAIVYVIVPTPLPTYSRHENVLKTAVTTKVIHSTGILRETIAYDLGSVVSTKNLAWDADTGQVLLTETVNEYNDNYFSFNFPAYWNTDYLGMGQAATNLNLSWNLDMVANGTYKFSSPHNAKDYLLAGDELWITQTGGVGDGYEEPIYGDRPRPFRAWVTNVDNNGYLTLIDDAGLRVDKYKLKKGSFKVIRSGYRNLQMASMASVTSMTNPLNTLVNGKLNPNLYQSTSWNDYKIINASAIEYANEWAGQCECNLPEMPAKDQDGNLVFEYEVIDYDNEDFDFIGIMDKSFNPYVYNVLGNWRAKASYAYLTGRYASENVTPRVAGFFNTFSPYYKLNSTNWKWEKNTAHLNEWTFASEVTQYSPYGQEIENKDALERYSSALYGYNYRFPLAVASNTRYSELAYDGFEDYDFSECNKNTHFNFKDSLDANNITVTGNHYHTGKKSLRVAPKDADSEERKITIQKQIISCNDVIVPVTLKKRKAKRTKK